MRQLPEQWRQLAERRGLPQSASGIARAADLATTTVTRLVFDGITSPATIRAVAEVLGVSTDTITRMAGLSRGDIGPWDPPVASHKLTARQRDAIERLILAIVDEGDETNGQQPEAGEKTLKVAGRDQLTRAADRGRNAGAELRDQLDRQAEAGAVDPEGPENGA